MAPLPADLLEKLLLIGICLLIAAVVGGGLQAAGVSIPVLSDSRTRAIIGFLGIVIMGLAYFSIQQAAVLKAQADQEAKAVQFRSDFNTAYGALVRGTDGAPPPPRWSEKMITDNLEPLAIAAGSDADMNCELTSFVEEHQIQYGDWPPTLKVRFQNAAKALGGDYLACYKAVIAQAQVTAATPRTICKTVADGSDSRLSQSSLITSDRALAQNVDANTPIGAFADFAIMEGAPNAGTTAVAQASETAPNTPGTSILEAITTVGQRGWMYLGTRAYGGLGPDRTIVATAPAVNGFAVVRVPVHLHALGTDSDYRAHKIVAVIPRGSSVRILRVTPQSNGYIWALIVITKLP